MSITTDDLLDALREALAQPAEGDGTSLADLAQAMGYGEQKVRALLRQVQAKGQLEVVRMRRPNLIGGTSVVPGYRIKK